MENPYLNLVESANNQQKALIFLNGYQMKQVQNCFRTVTKIGYF